MGMRSRISNSIVRRLSAPIMLLVTIGIAASYSNKMVLIVAGAAANSSTCSYPALFVFGDALSDTGNGPLTGNLLFQRATMPPYGETFPGRPASRLSDGRLLIDFLATFLGLPFVNPSLKATANFTHGVNYAVSGATALNRTFLNTRLVFPVTRDSLEVQLSRHLAFQASVTSSPASTSGKPDPTYFSTGLYVIAIGGNDYIRALQSPLFYSASFVTATFIPLVISKIRDVTETLYANGARNFLFISITPLGCSPSLLSSKLVASKDSNGCIVTYNSIAYNHGVQLQNEVRELRTAHPNGTFLFADYYGAYEYVLNNNMAQGFTNTLDACCGAGPLFPNKYNILLFCNRLSRLSSLTLCGNPNSYVNWDGIHFTDRFNHKISNLTFLTGNFLDPNTGFSPCSTSNP